MSVSPLIPGTELTFVDTNVIAHAHDRSEPEKRSRAASLLSRLWRRRSGVVSTQVLQELYVVLTRKLPRPLTSGSARELLALYAQWHVVEVDVALVLAAAHSEARHRLSFWDALIVEAASRAGATHLVSEDLQAGRLVRGVRITNPFA
jgi:predicted nucleic acid-binding protein